MDQSETTNIQQVFWGPLTLDEIKQELSINKPVYMIERRSSIGDLQPSRVIYENLPESEYLLENDNDSVEISFLSEYVTAQESLPSNNESHITINSSSNSDRPIGCSNALSTTNDATSSNLVRASASSDNLQYFSNLLSDEENISKVESALPHIEQLSINSELSFTNNSVEKYTKEFNESLKSPSENFNDTLEEIELLLNLQSDATTDDILKVDKCMKLDINHYGIQNSKDKLNSPLSKNKAVSKKNCTKVDSKGKYFPNAEIKFKEHSPRTFISKQCKKLNDYDFKTPSKLPIYCKSPNLKNIVSPIAAYIKHTPRVPLKQQIPDRPLASSIKLKTSSEVISKNNKENTLTPRVVYKPSRSTVVSDNSKIKVPASIQKHLPDTLKVMKHEGRLNKKINVVPAEEKLEYSDLTLTDLTLNSTSTDVSILTCKNAYNY